MTNIQSKHVAILQNKQIVLTYICVILIPLVHRDATNGQIISILSHVSVTQISMKFNVFLNVTLYEAVRNYQHTPRTQRTCDVRKTQANGDLLQAPKHTSSLAQISFHVPALLFIYNSPPYPRKRNLQSHSCQNVKHDANICGFKSRCCIMYYIPSVHNNISLQ